MSMSSISQWASFRSLLMMLRQKKNTLFILTAGAVHYRGDSRGFKHNWQGQSRR